jgi:hypothetical protein
MGDLTQVGRAGGRTDYSDAACLEVVSGDLEISYQFDTIKDLSGLSQLQSVRSVSVLVTRGFESLSGVSSLTVIDEAIFLRDTKGLVSIAGLERVQNFEGDLILMDNEDLVSLAGLEKVRVLKAMTLLRNAKLSSLDGLSGRHQLEPQSSGT